MNLYNCLVKFDNHHKIKDLIIIKDGFSFRAFIFNPLWFLFHKMWKEFSVFIGIFLAFALFSKFVSDVFWIEIILLIMIALNSKSWLLEHLMANKKYQLMAMVFAHNETQAKIKFVNYLYVDNKSEVEKFFVDAILNPKSARKSKLKYFL